MNQRLLGNKVESLEATFDALMIYEKLGNVAAQAASYVQLGSNSVVDEEYEEAISYFSQSFKMYEQLTDTVSITNYALAKINLGEAYRLLDRFDSANYWFRSSLADVDKVRGFDKTIVEAYNTGNIGMVYNAKDSLQLAREYLSRAVVLTQELGDLYSTSVYMADLALVEQKQGNAPKAEATFLQAYEMAVANGLKEQARDISKLLVDFYGKQQAFGSALVYQKAFQAYQDSLVNRENVQKVEQLKANYEIDKRDTEIKLLNTIGFQKTLLSTGLGVGLVGLSVFLYLIFRANKRLRQTNHNLEIQKAAVTKRDGEKAWLLRELNHRVRNNFQLISSLLALHEEKLKGHPAEASISADKYRVRALSLVHRNLYEEDHQVDIELDKYLKELVAQLFFSFGAGWAPSFQLDPILLHADKAMPLALIVNELVTNALKYAFSTVEEPSLLVVGKVLPHTILIEIHDNGSGLPEETSEEQGFGMQIVEKLVEQIEGTLKHLPLPGTVWRLEFPN